MGSLDRYLASKYAKPGGVSLSLRGSFRMMLKHGIHWQTATCACETDFATYIKTMRKVVMMTRIKTTLTGLTAILFLVSASTLHIAQAAKQKDATLDFMNRCALEGEIRESANYIACCMGNQCVVCKKNTPTSECEMRSKAVSTQQKQMLGTQQKQMRK